MPNHVHVIIDMLWPRLIGHHCPELEVLHSKGGLTIALVDPVHFGIQTSSIAIRGTKAN